MGLAMLKERNLCQGVWGWYAFDRTKDVLPRRNKAYSKPRKRDTNISPSLTVGRSLSKHFIVISVSSNNIVWFDTIVFTSFVVDCMKISLSYNGNI